MAAKKQAPAAETTPEVSAPEPSPGPTVAEIEAEMNDLDAWGDPEDAPPPPREPVRKYEIPRPEPTRCGGYVLTERGWEIDTAAPEQEK